VNKSVLEESLKTKTLAEIGNEHGMSRQGVHYFVKRYGLKVGRVAKVSFKCYTCGKDAKMGAGRYAASLKHFCGFGCYKAYLNSPGYRETIRGTAKEVETYV
jgi:hypothetical protein